MLNPTDHRLQVLPSNYPSPQLSLEIHNSTARILQPLSSAAENSQFSALASVGLYNDAKDANTRDMSGYIIPAVSVQPPPRQDRVGSSLELRRQSVRKQRNDRYVSNRNPIYDSPQYLSYRQRQTREGSSDVDQKWPDVLEDAFLDALLSLPPMGRRKFSIQGRPHGRNELIAEYLWIAYCCSLAPNQPRDESMKRTRKQVSSHIQVLKSFLRDHPASSRLFPPKNLPKNGFEDSFKDDPCLKAIAEGRLPGKRFANFQVGRVSVRPASLYLLITNSPDDEGAVCHRYTRLAAERPAKPIDYIPNWRQRFPLLRRLHHSNELNCDIIHMDATLELMDGHVPSGSFLTAKTEISIPGRELEGCLWKTTTSLNRPHELYRDHIKDPPGLVHENTNQVISVSDIETRIKLPFPPTSWAHVFTSLTQLQSKYDDYRLNGAYGEDNSCRARPAREYLEQISMYQEVKSSRGLDLPYVRRGIIIWTFHKARHGETALTNWRYLSTTPPRSSCMSPSPHPTQQYAADMNENFSSFLDGSTPLHQASLLDTFVQGLSTPASNAVLQSTFESFDYSYNHDLQMDMGFPSRSVIDIPSTLEHGAANLENFLSSGNVQLGDYGHSSTSWNMQNPESFAAAATWPNYNVVPSNAPQIEWEPGSESHWQTPSDVKQDTWKDKSGGKVDWDHLEDQIEEPYEPTDWGESAGHSEEQQDWNGDAKAKDEEEEDTWTPTQEISAEQEWEMISHENGNHDWAGTSHSPQNAEQEHHEQAGGEHLATWVKNTSEETHNISNGVSNTTVPELDVETIAEKGTIWEDNGGNFDYQQVEQLKE